MANLTFEQKPINSADKIPVITNWTPVIGYMVLNDDIEDLFYFKLILEVYTGTSAVAANLIGKIKQRRNGYSSDVDNDRARAYFDLRDIVNTALVDTVFDQNVSGQPFSPIHSVGANAGYLDKIYSANGDNRIGKVQISAIYVVAYQEYAENITDTPSEYPSPTVNDTLWYLQASAPLFTARDDDADYLQSNYFQKYQGSDVNDLFLSDVESSVAEYNIGSVRRNYIQDTDYHTISFLNDYTNFQSDIDWIGITYRDATGSIIGNVQHIANTNANGGAIPSSEVDTDEERLLYFGCGPQNLETSTVDAYSSAGTSAGAAQPSNFADWAYYTVAGYAGGTFALMTNLYYFIKQDGSCKGFKVRRLGWRNSVGGYDYFNFKMKSTQTINVTRNNYNTLIGRFNGSKFSYNDTQRGITTRKVTAILKETLQTDWITEQDAILLEKLIMSTAVYIIENADTTYTEGVIITNSSFVKKTSANDKMIQYTINIEYANPVNTNS